jgi:hypothetical protein
MVRGRSRGRAYALAGAGLGLVTLLVVGCSSRGEPRVRIGSIPFPGAFTLYATADPAALGEHRYEEWWERGPEEVPRGIMYTRRAGFVDLAHVRETMDWTRYGHDRALEAICKGEGAVSVRWEETRFEVAVTYPAWWCDLGCEERRAVAEEWAVRIGQRLAVVVDTWHEIATWYGQESVPPISEKPSAFTWDDACSHAVGALAGGRALRSGVKDWDDAATAALSATLADLGVMPRGTETEVIETMKGRWWYDGLAHRRDLDTGLGTGWKRPWLVPSVDPGLEGPAQIPVATFTDVLGHDLSACTSVRVIPPRWLLRATTGERDARGGRALRDPEDLLAIIERVRADVHREFGPEGDQP